MVRFVYIYERLFDPVDDFGDAVYQAWNILDVQYIRIVYHSIPRMFVSIIEKKGFCADIDWIVGVTTN